MTASVTLSANAGISLCLGGKKIWVDALHDAKAHTEFSSVEPEMLEQIWSHEQFSPPDIIFFTHCHLDHYDKGMVQMAKERWPEAVLILPQPEFPNQLLVTGDTMDLSVCGVDFHFFTLPHEKVPYEEVPHYGAVISWDGFSVLVTGDCATANPVLAERIAGIPIDLALIDFPWITLRKGREFIRDRIAPKHLVVYHLPFPPEDRWGYRGATEHSLPLVESPDVRLLAEPLQTELF